MSAFRLPLLCAFAGGCLSSAVLFGVWRWDSDAEARVPAQKPLVQNSELLVASKAKARAEQPSEVSDSTARAPSPAAPSEPTAHSEPSAHGEPPAAEVDSPTPAGSAVADVLMDLEAAYRKRLAAAAPAPVAPEPDTKLARLEPSREAVVRTAALVASTAPVTIAPVEIAPVAIAPVAIAPSAVVSPVSAPSVVAAIAPVARVDTRPAAVHIGDINNINNTYITNVRGDLLLMQQQQVAMLQYMQLLGMSSLASRAGYGSIPSGFVGPAVAPVNVARASTPQFRQFPSTLTNPDNPWGFNFAPPNLVH